MRRKRRLLTDFSSKERRGISIFHPKGIIMIGFNENVVVKNPDVSPDVPWAALRSILQAKAREKTIFRKS